MISTEKSSDAVAMHCPSGDQHNSEKGLACDVTSVCDTVRLLMSYIRMLSPCVIARNCPSGEIFAQVAFNPFCVSTGVTNWNMLAYNGHLQMNVPTLKLSNIYRQ
ncbi:EC1118_1B15_3356p [Saccharomyces cerevisiae EC1118]|uniref:EC1118_1B15_3356p n=1 Tax=Saccharomyces cerevisiae (strain Lalvin EC1118 / Prise de mousse) TaxID=643680 RepID=D3UER9_YEAS8|nr:EC1118_1B15_3356p [Saccharomyces cerevisiae EC1118]